MRTVVLLLCLGISSVYASDADALAISANIQNRHLPFGTVLDPIFAAPDSNQITGYTRCGDSAIWTGYYLAAESYRYSVTHDPAALDNVRRATGAIKALADVTAINILARCAVPMSSPYAAGIQSEEQANGIYINNSAGEVWIGNTSRDQYTGVMFGLAVAYDLAADAEVRNTISGLVTRLVDFLSGHGWSVVMPGGSISTSFIIRPDQILSFLQVARHVNPDHFSTKYDVQRVLLSAEVPVPIGLESTNDSSYFKFNLDYANLFNLIRLESSSANTFYRSAYGLLRDHTASQQNAFFNMIDRALNGANAQRDAETVRMLDQWLLRPRRDKYVDLHGAVAVCGDTACQPVPVALRPPSDFIWQRNPFQLAGGGSGVIESAGIDYVLPYWMARYYGIIQGPSAAAITIQPAAANGPALAPGSIASIFGSNLAPAIAQAGSPTLPTSLAGVSVKVRDSAGVDRDTTLSYVAPGQINLVLPDPMAAGAAQFTVTNGATTQTVTGLVQTAAPSLFSMNGSGTGVAAATAERIQVANPQLRGPVEVFHCDSGGCTATPIDVGVDAPVYVSFYGTGIRHRTALSNVNVTIKGVRVPVLFAGAQGQFPGLDQVNVQLPLALRGSGMCDVVLSVDGQVSNTVAINIR